jgi:hypothetical protein
MDVMSSRWRPGAGFGVAVTESSRFIPIVLVSC